jgi:hypothetical protein
MLSGWILAALFAVPTNEGKLCVAGQACVTAKLDEAVVQPAETMRAFTWFAPEARSFAFGVLAASATRIEKLPAAALRVRSGKALASLLTIRGKQSLEWRVPLTPEQTKSGVDVRIDPGEYEIALEAPHHRRIVRTRTVGAEPVVVMLSLEPLPQITGRILNAKDHQPVGGATVAAAKKMIAVTTGDGRFAAEIDPEEWPASLTISAGTFGTLIVPVPRARVSTDLLDIELSVAAAVDVAVNRPDQAPVTIAIYKRRGGTKDEEPLASRSLDGDKVRFESLAPGDYAVIANGKDDGERIGMRITVAAAEEKSVVLEATPRRLTIRTERGGEPLPNADVRLIHRDGLWDTRTRTGSDGSVDITIWQLGLMTAVAARQQPPLSPFVTQRDIGGDSDTTWTITMPTRSIRGFIADAETGKGIPDAHVIIEQARTSGPTLSTSIKADEQGRFHFDSATPGGYVFRAFAESYEPNSIRDSIRDEEEVHEVAITLKPAPAAKVIVRDSKGLPIPDAAVLDFAGLQLKGERLTDANGEVRVPLGPGEVRDVYAIPRDGSIGTATLRTREDVTISVPIPQTTIVINCVDDRGQPVPQIWVVMRINGIPLPLEVMYALMNHQGATVFSGPDGRIVLRQMPLGVHEFWPLTTPTDIRSALLGLGKKAPVTIVAHAGVNEATLTFAERKKP